MLVYEENINLFNFSNYKFQPNYGIRGLALATFGKISGYLLLMRPDLITMWACMHVPLVMASLSDYKMNRNIIISIDIVNNGC